MRNELAPGRTPNTHRTTCASLSAARSPRKKPATSCVRERHCRNYNSDSSSGSGGQRSLPRSSSAVNDSGPAALSSGHRSSTSLHARTPRTSRAATIFIFGPRFQRCAPIRSCAQYIVLRPTFQQAACPAQNRVLRPPRQNISSGLQSPCSRPVISLNSLVSFLFSVAICGPFPRFCC